MKKRRRIIVDLPKAKVILPIHYCYGCDKYTQNAVARKLDDGGMVCVECIATFDESVLINRKPVRGLVMFHCSGCPEKPHIRVDDVSRPWEVACSYCMGVLRYDPPEERIAGFEPDDNVSTGTDAAWPMCTTCNGTGILHLSLGNNPGIDVPCEPCSGTGLVQCLDCMDVGYSVPPNSLTPNGVICAARDCRARQRLQSSSSSDFVLVLREVFGEALNRWLEVPGGVVSRSEIMSTQTRTYYSVGGRDVGYLQSSTNRPDVITYWMLPEFLHFTPTNITFLVSNCPGFAGGCVPDCTFATDGQCRRRFQQLQHDLQNIEADTDYSRPEPPVFFAGLARSITPVQSDEFERFLQWARPFISEPCLRPSEDRIVYHDTRLPVEPVQQRVAEAWVRLTQETLYYVTTEYLIQFRNR